MEQKYVVRCNRAGVFFGDPARDRMTVREFLRLTADAYGGEVIRAVAERYDNLLNNNDLKTSKK